MGMPQDILSPVPYVADFRAPRDRAKTDLEAFERGGVALRDTQGKFLDFQNWIATCDGTNVQVDAETTLDSEIIYTGLNITEIDLAFDQTMNPYLALVEDGVCRFWWYDSQNETYALLDIPDGSSPRITLDDHQRRDSNLNDVLMFYVVGSTMYMRKQRDKFAIEYELATGVTELQRVGMGVNRRMQFELGVADNATPTAVQTVNV